MTIARQTLGRRAEDLVAQDLTARGWVVLERNARPKGVRGELDIVARERGWIVFVEVKSTSASARRGPETPLAMVGHRKQLKLRSLAGAWMRENRERIGPVASMRIDVVALQLDGDGRPTVWRHVRGAC